MKIQIYSKIPKKLIENSVETTRIPPCETRKTLSSQAICHAISELAADLYSAILTLWIGKENKTTPWGIPRTHGKLRCVEVGGSSKMTVFGGFEAFLLSKRPCVGSFFSELIMALSQIQAILSI